MLQPLLKSGCWQETTIHALADCAENFDLEVRRCSATDEREKHLCMDVRIDSPFKGSYR
jgi:hypothetical protein